AKSNANSNLYAAGQTAVALGATEISNSWGGQEPSSDSAVFNHPGTVITAATGDDGYLDWFSGTTSEFADYPASSPHVVAVGGSRLTLSASKAWESETVWNDGGVNGGTLEGSGATGGGCSGHFSAPAWQQSTANWAAVGCGSTRAAADVAADGDPYSGVAVYNSTESPQGEKGWAAIGGTSVASPIIASIFALAGGAQGVAYPARLLYENELHDPASLHDVTVGANGVCEKKFHKNSGVSGCTSTEAAQSCSQRLICLAAPGFDGPSGVGTPHGLAAFEPPVPGGTVELAVTPEGQAAETEPPPLPPTGTSAPGGAGTQASATPVVSALSLTRSALAALRKRPKVSKVGYAFTLNTAARVRVTIAQRVRVHGRARWRNISTPLTVTARVGSQSHRLTGHAMLAPGNYLLTVAPEHGASRSIVFRIG
ncbi:MAG TPA: S8 family serine peptidase, partial [Solirubrobacteraceae bacterium]